MLLAISSFLIVLFILGPLALTSRGALGHGWLRQLAYFACLGGAFMLIEVALLQRFVLLLGHPVYSLTVTLFSLLLGTGLGSVLSRRIADARVKRAAMIACVTVALVALLWGSVLPSIVQAAIAWPLHAAPRARRRADDAGRDADGHPAPRRRAAAVGDPGPQLVAWAWGMNGGLSVLGAILAVFIAMNWGFSVTLACGAAVYAIAAILVSGPSTIPPASSTQARRQSDAGAVSPRGRGEGRRPAGGSRAPSSCPGASAWRNRHRRWPAPRSSRR